MSKYTIISGVSLDDVLLVARGSYQRALLSGAEAWSGATLKGKARSYGKHYKYSRQNLLNRLRRLFDVDMQRVGKGSRIVVFIQKKS